MLGGGSRARASPGPRGRNVNMPVKRMPAGAFGGTGKSWSSSAGALPGAAATTPRCAMRRSTPEIGLESVVAAARHLVALVNDRDAVAISRLYSPAGVHVDPQREDEDGRAARHEGRSAISAYFAGVFHETPWLAMRLISLEVEPAQEPPVEGGDEVGGSGAARMRVEYMDPRLEAPLVGEWRIRAVAGRIMESELHMGEAPD